MFLFVFFNLKSRKKNEMNDTESFYSTVVREQKGTERAETDWTGCLRLFNNFAKAYGLARFTNTNLPVICFDYSCGKGGDYFKLIRLFPSIVRYVGMDITEKSIQDFKERTKESVKKPELHTRDLRYPIEQEFHGSFTLINMGFCFHYFWETKEILETCLHNMSNLLIPEGRCVITTVCKKNLLKRLEQKQKHKDVNDVRIINETNNLVCRFTYNKTFLPHGYFFELNDSLESQSVSAVEYFVDHDEIERISNENGMGLKIIHTETLLSFIRSRSGVGNSLYEFMGVPKEIGPLEESLLDLYEIIVIEKSASVHLPYDPSMFQSVLPEEDNAFDNYYYDNPSPPYSSSSSGSNYDF